MKEGKKPDKFLLPHGMPSDEWIICIFIEGIPYGFQNQNPVKSWNYQLGVIMRVLVTGTAGFIGSALAISLLERGDEVIGIDNVNDYYDVNLKWARLERVKSYGAFTDIRCALEDHETVATAFQRYQPQRVVNLAAQAGVRYSLENPHAYIHANV